MKRALSFLAMALAAAILCLVSCEDPVDPTPVDPAPTTITLSSNSFVLTEPAAAELSLTITAPTRPVLSGAPTWLTVKDGTYANYKITVTLQVAENPTYEERNATLTVKSGSLSATVTVKQAAQVKPVDPPTPEPGTELASFFGLGWNMGNQFDAYYNGSWAGAKEGYPDELCWQSGETEAEKAAHKATQATFNGVKNLGFTSVRIPVSWLKMIGPAPDYTIDEAWINRVYEVVQYAHNAGLKVIINTHHDENHGVDNTYQWLDIKNAANNATLNAQIKEKIKGAWTNIAKKFADCGDDWLMMEGFNELNDGGWGWSEDFKRNPEKQCNILNEWNQVFVDAVRATGGNNATRWLGVPSYCANPEFTKYMTLPKDPAGKIAVSVHFYDPSDYTIGEAQYTDWGHTGAAGKKASGGDEDHVKSVFGMLNTNYIAKGTPVYIGEFGCSMRSQSDNRAWRFYLYYMEYVVKAAKTYSLPCFLWDNGAEGNGQEHHGYIHHGTGKPIGNSKTVLDVLKKAWFTDRDGYTLDYVYSTAPQF